MIGEGVLFIVDGKEAEAIRSICPKAHFRKHTNGRNSILQLANECADLIDKAGSYKHYVITADLERRLAKDHIDFLQMSYELHSTISDLLNWDEEYRSRLVVGVADRMIENWLYAGISGDNGDGLHGTTLMESIGGYSKSTTAKKVLNNGDFNIGKALISPSFKHFFDQILNMNCDYIEFNYLSSHPLGSRA